MDKQESPLEDYRILSLQRRLAKVKSTQKRLERDMRKIKESHDIPRREREELLQRMRAAQADLGKLLALLQENKALREECLALKATINNNAPSRPESGIGKSDEEELPF